MKVSLRRAVARALEATMRALEAAGRACRRHPIASVTVGASVLNCMIAMAFGHGVMPAGKPYIEAPALGAVQTCAMGTFLNWSGRHIWGYVIVPAALISGAPIGIGLAWLVDGMFGPLGVGSTGLATAVHTGILLSLVGWMAPRLPTPPSTGAVPSIPLLLWGLR